jgi:hypothetical protein
MDFTVEQTYGALSDVLTSAPGVGSGMRRLLEHCARVCPSDVWRRIAALDFRGDSARLRRWLEDVLGTDEPAETIVAFWFGLFDETLPDGGAFARLYISGSEAYDPDEKNSGWACSPAYFPEGRYADSEVLRPFLAW